MRNQYKLLQEAYSQHILKENYASQIAKFISAVQDITERPRVIDEPIEIYGWEFDDLLLVANKQLQQVFIKEYMAGTDSELVDAVYELAVPPGGTRYSTYNPKDWRHFQEGDVIPNKFMTALYVHLPEADPSEVDPSERDPERCLEQQKEWVRIEKVIMKAIALAHELIQRADEEDTGVRALIQKTTDITGVDTSGLYEKNKH
jgi:hypothetical protein